MVATLVFLGGLGVQSIIGTGYAWWAERTIPDWQQVGYPGYVALMNVDRRAVRGRARRRAGPVRAQARALADGARSSSPPAWSSRDSPAGPLTGSLTTGLAAYLVLASLLQAAVVVMTFFGAKSLRYMTEGRIVKTGSGLLHMGFLVFALVVVALQQSPADAAGVRAVRPARDRRDDAELLRGCVRGKRRRAASA